MGALWELPGSSLGALWELVAVAGIRFQILNGYRKHELTAEKPFNLNKGESFYDKSTVLFYHNVPNPSSITTNERRQRQ